MEQPPAFSFANDKSIQVGLLWRPLLWTTQPFRGRNVYHPFACELGQSPLQKFRKHPLHAPESVMSNDSTRLAVLSRTQICLLSFAAGLFAAGFAIFVQWLIYDDWLHEAGPVEIAGSVLAGILMFLLVFRTLHAARLRKREMIQRLEAIRWMNDRIRNSLQTIECITYAAAPHVTDDVRNAVDVIEGILSDFLVDRHPHSQASASQSQSAHATSQQFR